MSAGPPITTATPMARATKAMISVMLRCDRWGRTGDRRILAETYGDVVRELPLHRESRSLGPDGEVCGRATRGELARRTVELGTATPISKESTQLSVDGLEGVYRRTQTLEPAHDDWPALPEALGTLGTAEVARALRVNESTVKRWKSGRMRPHLRQLEAIRAWLARRRAPKDGRGPSCR